MPWPDLLFFDAEFMRETLVVLQVSLLSEPFMPHRLDEHSRDAIGRFAVKLFASSLLAGFGSHQDYLAAITTWASLYAVLTSALALVRQERFVREAFNHWDETLWLIVAALTLHRLWLQA